MLFYVYKCIYSNMIIFYSDFCVLILVVDTSTCKLTTRGCHRFADIWILNLVD